MLVNNRLSAWARTWAAVGSVECTSVAASILLRPTAVVKFLPGNDPDWAVGFFAIGAALLGLAAVVGPTRRLAIFCFVMAATAHAVYAVGALGYALTADTSWILASTMAALAGLNFLAAIKIAGVRH